MGYSQLLTSVVMSYIYVSVLSEVFVQCNISTVNVIKVNIQPLNKVHIAKDLKPEFSIIRNLTLSIRYGMLCLAE